MNQPTTPLIEQDIKFFRPKKTVGFFGEDGRSFVGLLYLIEYDTNELTKIVVSLTVTFLWAVEIPKMSDPPIKNPLIFRKDNPKVRTLIQPHKRPVPKEKEGMLVCCGGEEIEKKLTLSQRVIHLQLVKQIGEEYGISKP